MSTDIAIEPLKRLSRDLKQAAKQLTPDEARYLVDAYYQMQENRIRSQNQIRAITQSDDADTEPEPHETLAWLGDNTAMLERNIKNALDAYGDAHLVGRWSKEIVGIGPVISAGLLAHIDITKAPTVGHIWRFAGLDPTQEWNKGQKRPWNASLKTLCWKVGESFVKVSGHDADVYGKLYLARKAYESAKNDASEYATQAAAKLERFRIGKGTEARKHYEGGKLPPGHLHARAKRWAVKLFLAHWHAVAYRDHFNENAPKPYVLSQLQHGHEIACPHWPF